MKGKKFYVFLGVILLIGVSAVHFYRQKQSERYLEFEAYEIENIEKEIASLYNEEKTDLSDKLSTEQLDNIQEELEELKNKEYSLENQQRLDKVEEEYLMAKAMDELQTDIKGLFIEEGIIKKDLTLDEVINLEEQIGEFQEKVVYYDRNQTTLADAKEQVNVIQAAKSYIDDLFEEDSVRIDVTRENEEEALELIQKIKNEEAREELLARAEIINLALTEAEEALALEEALAEEEAAAQQALEEAEELEETSEQTEWQPNQSETWNNSGNTGNTNNTNNTSNWRPPSNSSGSETTSQGNSQPSNPSSEETTNEAEYEETDTSSEVELEPEEPPAEQEEDTNEEQ